MIHKSQFTNLPVTSDALVCHHCKKHLKRGSDALMRFNSDSSGVSTEVFCDEFCLSAYNEKRQSAVNKMLNRFNTQFN